MHFRFFYHKEILASDPCQQQNYPAKKHPFGMDKTGLGWDDPPSRRGWNLVKWFFLGGGWAPFLFGMGVGCCSDVGILITYAYV